MNRPTILIFVAVMLSSFGLMAQVIVNEPESNSGQNATSPEMVSYSIAVKTRPLSYLIVPLSLGAIAVPNIEAELPTNRASSVCFGFNYTYINAVGVGAASQANNATFKIDYRFYLIPKSRPQDYAEGFFLGPYLKFRITDMVEKTTVGTVRVNGIGTIVGGALGYQWIIDEKFVISPLFGLGGGLGYFNSGIAILPDARMSLSAGLCF